MKVHGDYESVNLSTGVKHRRVVGDGESRLVAYGEIRLGPRGPTEEEILAGNEAIDKIILEAQRRLKMHYRNGREAKNGDKVIQLGMSGAAAGQIIAVGVLYDAKPGNDFCNGSIAPVQQGVTGACMCDCLHVDDLAAILAEKGLDKRPDGK